jgi:hypothetical protein
MLCDKDGSALKIKLKAIAGGNMKDAAHFFGNDDSP